MPPQPAKTELRAGSLLAGKYKLQRQLGRGASGAVWAAINIATSRKVALKVLLRPEPKARERLLREAKAAGALNHPNVVDVYDVIVADDGSPALVLEFLEGQTLEQLIAERAPLPEHEVAAIARDVARALGVAHASGIVHRDLKPANIFLHRPAEDEGPVVKVVDFGISKNTLAREETLTETGMAVGSPSFMSPEQVRGERDLDGRTDLWALGVIMYEMLSGRRLFDGRAHEVLTHVLTQPIKPLAELVAALDPEVDRVVAGLLERDLGRRFASADDVAAQLATIAAAAKDRSMHPTESPPTSKSQPRDPLAVHVPKAGALPVIHAEDDEEEATHVAPMAMREALAQQTVPNVYDDEEEDEEDRTRVAPDAVLTAAIKASREAAAADKSDQNTIPTVRPPAPPKAESDPPAERTIADNAPPAHEGAAAAPVTEGGTQIMPTQQLLGAVAAPPSGKTPASDKGAPRTAVDKAAGAKAAGPASGKAAAGQPVSGKAVVPSPPSNKAAAVKPAAEKAPSSGVASKGAVAKPAADKGAAAKPASEREPVAKPVSDKAGAAKPVSDKAGAAKPVSEKEPVSKPVSEKAPASKPASERPAAGAPSSSRAEKMPSSRPAADGAAKVVIDKAVSERPPAAEGAPASSRDAHEKAPSVRPLAASERPKALPSSVETAIHKVPARRSDTARTWMTWVLTVIVIALVLLAAYLYTHRG